MRAYLHRCVDAAVGRRVLPLRFRALRVLAVGRTGRHGHRRAGYTYYRLVAHTAATRVAVSAGPSWIAPDTPAELPDRGVAHDAAQGSTSASASQCPTTATTFAGSGSPTTTSTPRSDRLLDARWWCRQTGRWPWIVPPPRCRRDHDVLQFIPRPRSGGAGRITAKPMLHRCEFERARLAGSPGNCAGSSRPRRRRHARVDVTNATASAVISPEPATAPAGSRATQVPVVVPTPWVSGSRW